MNSNDIARHTLIKLSPEYAQRRTYEMTDDFIADVAARPEVYRAAIQATPPKSRKNLEAWVNFMIDYATAQDDTQRAEIDARWWEATQGKFAPQVDVFLTLHFRDGSGRDKEFATAVKSMRSKQNEHR